MNLSKSTHRGPGLRQAIAGLAARMMAEDGIDDYGFAKRKAARQLGAADGDLPNNAEVEAELRAYQALYQGEELQARLKELRQIALAAMELLAPFNPYLTGSVLDGTAGRYAKVELELFPDSAKDVEIFLLNKGFDVEQREPGRHAPETVEAILELELDETPISLTILDPVAERSRSKNSDRAKAAAVAALLAEEDV